MITPDVVKNVEQVAQPSILEINNGQPYGSKNLGPVLDFDDIREYLTIKAWPGQPGTVRFSNNFLVLRYVDYTPPKLELLAFLITLGPIDDKETVISQNHNQTLVYLKFVMDKNKYWTSSAQNVFEYRGNQPQVYSFGKAGKPYTRDWIMKADPSYVEKAKDRYNVFDMVNKCNDEKQVIQACGKPSDVSGMLLAYDVCKKSKRKTDTYILNYMPWGWQLALIELIWKTPNERDIYWFWNNVPKLGKSTIGYLLMAKYPEYFHVICNPSFGKDTVTNLFNANKRGWNGHCLILNLTMSYDGLEWLYSVLELVKDSVLSTSKYNGESWIKGCSHLVVFANFEPYPYDEKTKKPLIDRDRLKIMKIPEPGSLGDPNKPREEKPIPLPMFNIRDEDIPVRDGVLASMTSGSAIKLKEKAKQKTGVEGLFEEVQGPTFQYPLQIQSVPIFNPPVIADPVFAVAHAVKADYSNLKPKPKPEEPKWRKYLVMKCKCLKDNKCICGGRENDRSYLDVLFNDNNQPRENGVHVCRKREYCNFAMWHTVISFYKYYKLLEPLMRNIYEIIPDHFHQKPYFDLDIPSEYMSEVDSKLLVNQIEQGILKVEPEIKERDIMIFSSHSSSKRSYHIVVDRWYVTNSEENKTFYDMVVERVDARLKTITVVEEGKSIVKDVIDPVVYKPNQQFRLYGSTKFNGNRPKILAEQNKWQPDEKYENEEHKELLILKSSLITLNTGWKGLKIVANEKKKVYSESVEYSGDQIETIRLMVEAKLPGVFSYTGPSGGFLHFKRLRRAHCTQCDRSHDNEGIAIYMKRNDPHIYFHCYRTHDNKNPINIISSF